MCPEALAVGTRGQVFPTSSPLPTRAQTPISESRCELQKHAKYVCV